MLGLVKIDLQRQSDFHKQVPSGTEIYILLQIAGRWHADGRKRRLMVGDGHHMQTGVTLQHRFVLFVFRFDGIDDEQTKRYMHHYNFPSYSVGEAKPSRGPGRREIGHGALAERALVPVIPNVDDFPYSIRLVSEVMSSNGSTSQGYVCGSTLALMDAGVPIKAPVAGISCGLITEGDKFMTMVDIQGLEDFFGDMDFKVAGTRKGITAIQMDLKNG